MRGKLHKSLLIPVMRNQITFNLNVLQARVSCSKALPL